MKSLLILAAMAATASAEVRTYDIKPYKAGRFYVSCSSTERMLRDKHVLKIDDVKGTVRVDGFLWDPWTTFDDSELTASFHSVDQLGNMQHTILIIQLDVTDRSVSGLYILQGLTPSREPCSNSVWVEGRRR